jgi:putative salt-induced outer membrane protein
MRFIRALTGILILFLSMTGAYGQDKKWRDEAEFSFVDTSGNTDVATLSARNFLGYQFTNKLEGSWKLAALYGETGGEKNAESYLSELRADYLLTQRLYSFATGGWSKDQFAGIDSRYYLGPGIGYKFFKGPIHFLIAEAGLNYVAEKYIDDTDRDYLGGRTYAKYEYAFSDKNRFSQSVEFLYDFDESENYNVNSETAIIFALSNYLSFKTSYVVKFDNQPVPSTLEETDTFLSTTMVVTF